MESSYLMAKELYRPKPKKVREFSNLYKRWVRHLKNRRLFGKWVKLLADIAETNRNGYFGCQTQYFGYVVNGHLVTPIDRPFVYDESTHKMYESFESVSFNTNHLNHKLGMRFDGFYGEFLNWIRNNAK